MHDPAAVDFQWLPAAVGELAEVMQFHAEVDLLELRVGAPAEPGDVRALEPTEEALEEEGFGSTPDFPAFVPGALEALASAADGLVLHWRWRPAGKVPVGGFVALPSLEEHQRLKSDRHLDNHLVWELVRGTGHARVLLEDASERVYLLDADTDEVKAEALEVEDVLRACLDRLGIPGWELALYDAPSPEEAAALEACEARAREVRTALGLDLPRALAS